MNVHVSYQLFTTAGALAFGDVTLVDINRPPVQPADIEFLRSKVTAAVTKRGISVQGGQVVIISWQVF